ncbi:hypothetical protein [Nonomuraea ceibae]|uniref:hypothetical protein n=1 Tax=Nonomuraea ceibae TaxID=1935170 RepID=UPI001C5FC903|nr:hypothetical protein [Nonomuraea ceibae]
MSRPKPSKPAPVTIELANDAEAVASLELMRSVHLALQTLDPRRKRIEELKAELKAEQEALKAQEDKLRQPIDLVIVALQPRLGADGVGTFNGVPVVRGYLKPGARKFKTDEFFRDHQNLAGLRDAYTSVSEPSYDIKILPGAFPGGSP